MQGEIVFENVSFGYAGSDRRQYQHLIGNGLPCPKRDPLGTDDVHVQRQVRPMLLDGPTRHNADFPHLHSVVNFRPR